MKKLTQKRLKELVHYDPVTGIFTRKTTKNNVLKKGDIVGTNSYYGYLQFTIDRKSYYLHRLVWLYVYGYFPENQIDHINQIKTDNRVCNLREVSNQCNSRNCGNSKNNVTGVKGVYWNKSRGQWHTFIYLNSKRIHLGFHKNFDEAVCTRLAGEQCLNWSGCDSSSPAYQYVQRMLKKEKITKNN